MDSELQRLRLRVRQLEREVRALRSAARHEDEGEERGAGASKLCGTFSRRRVVNPWPSRGHDLPVTRDAAASADAARGLPTG